MKAFAVAAAFLIAAAPVAAADYSQELALMEKVSDSGISVVVVDNDVEPICQQADGFYMPNKGEPILGICVKNDTWTEYNSMVLRHEVVHAIQDCRDDNPNSPEILAAGLTVNGAKVAADNLGINLGRLLAPYIADGANDHVLLLEAEAFVKGFGLSTSDISEEFDRVCRES